MDIITQPGEVVNIVSSRVPMALRQQLADLSGKWTQHKAQCPEIARKLAAAGYPSRAWRVEHCGEKLYYTFCQRCGKSHVTGEDLCRDRFCPVCTWRLSMRRFARMVQIVDGLRHEHADSEWAFVTLTVENCKPSELGRTLDEMAHAWDIIMRRKATRESIIGWARSLEVTYNQQTHTLHPHYHVLCLMAPGYSGTDTYLQNAWISTVDLRAVPKAQDTQRVQCLAADQTGDDPDAVVSAILETYKYTVKSKDLQEMPLKIFRELSEGLKNRRMVAFGGVVKQYAKTLDIDVEDEETEDADEEAEDLARCAECGSTRVIQIVGAWTGDGYLWRRTARF